MKSYIVFVIILISNFSFSQKKLEELNDYEISYLASCKKKSDTINILFRNGFNDSILVYYKDQLVFEGFAKTNESIGSTNIRIPIVVKNDCCLKIVFKDKNEYMIIDIPSIYTFLKVNRMSSGYKLVFECREGILR